MRIKRTDTIAGEPIKLARDLSKKLCDFDDGVSVEWITQRILKNQDIAKAQMLVREMTNRGWLMKTKKGNYECTPAGRGLALARLLSPISRAKANDIVANLIKRAHAINENPDFITWVRQLRVFGSYNSTSDDLGDVDVAFELKRRPVHDWVAASQERARASGKNVSWITQLYYGDHEVKLFLKNRERYLSLHDVEELQHLKAKSRSIYEWKETV